MSETPETPAPVLDALAVLAAPRPMRRGSVSLRRIRCGKPGCPCASDPGRRHGPYASLTRAVGGTTRSRLLTADQAALARAQVEAGRGFGVDLEAYWRACERWADAELGAVEDEGGQRGGSDTPSRRRSRPRSTPS